MRLRVALAGLVLGLAACGEGAGDASAAMAFALTPALAEEVAQLQVAFVRGSSADCATIRRTCLKGQGRDLQPVGGTQAGESAWLVDFAKTDEQLVEIAIAPGTYLVVVEALDSTGDLVANACKLNVRLGEGSRVDQPFTLEATDADCDARLR